MSAVGDGALPPRDTGPVAQWIRHLTTNEGIPGSSPGGVAQEGFPFKLDMHACLNDRDQVSGALAFPKIALTMS